MAGFGPVFDLAFEVGGVVTVVDGFLGYGVVDLLECLVLGVGVFAVDIAGVDGVFCCLSGGVECEVCFPGTACPVDEQVSYSVVLDLFLNFLLFLFSVDEFGGDVFWVEWCGVVDYRVFSHAIPLVRKRLSWFFESGFQLRGLYFI